MKTIVLENVNRLDADFSAYLSKYYSDSEIKIFTNVIDIDNNEKYKNEIIDALSKAEKLIVCTTLNENANLFIELLLKFENIKDIEILYRLTGLECDKFIKLVNQCDQQDQFRININKLVKTRNVTQILTESYSLETNDKKYFKSMKYLFDRVPLYYNEKYNVIFFKRQPKQLILNDFLYLEDNNTNDIINDSTVAIKINKEDISTYKSLIEETKAFINYQYELRKENDSEFLEESKEWLKLIEKIKI